MAVNHAAIMAKVGTRQPPDRGIVPVNSKEKGAKVLLNNSRVERPAWNAYSSPRKAVESNNLRSSRQGLDSPDMNDSSTSSVTPRTYHLGHRHGYGYGNMSKEVDNKDLPFLKDDPYTDTILVVEDKSLYIHRSLLGYASQHFQKLFHTAHATVGGDKTGKVEVKIEGKSYADFVDMLAFFHPGVCRDLNEKSAVRLLPLAHEYEMAALKRRCELVLVDYLKMNEAYLKNKSKGPSIHKHRKDNVPDIVLKCTKAADKGQSKVVMDQCLKMFTYPEIPLKDLKCSTEVSDHIKSRIFESRVQVTSDKLSRVLGELEKEKQEKDLLRKRLLKEQLVKEQNKVTFRVPKPQGGERPLYNDEHPIPSTVPIHHEHHYHTHHRQNIAEGKPRKSTTQPTPVTNRKSGSKQHR